jgi:hypothetical protein
MKFLKLALVAAAASVAMGGAAMAQDATGLKLSYNVGVASDYIFRGVSNTNTNGQVFGGVDATYGIGYAGVWTSNVDFGTPNPDQEIDVYAGVKPTVGPASLDFGVIYYGYTKDKNGAPGSVRLLRSQGRRLDRGRPGHRRRRALLLAGIPGRRRRSPVLRNQRLGPDRRKADPERRPGPSGSRHRRLLRRHHRRLHHLEHRRHRRDHRPRERGHPLLGHQQAATSAHLSREAVTASLKVAF